MASRLASMIRFRTASIVRGAMKAARMDFAVLLRGDRGGQKKGRSSEFK